MRFGELPKKVITVPAFYKQTEAKFKVKLGDRLKGAALQNEGTGTPFQLTQTANLSADQKQAITNELVNGNPYLIAQFERHRALHTVAIHREREEMGYTIAGSFVDVGRYVTGEPHCMVSFLEQQPTQLIDVLLNLDTILVKDAELQAHCNKRAMIYYSAALSAVDSLEASGYRVRLIGVNYSDFVAKSLYCQSSPVIHEVRVLLKDYHEPVNTAYFTAVCLGRTQFMQYAMMRRPNIDLSPYYGCDLLPGFSEFINRHSYGQNQSVYIWSLTKRHQHPKNYYSRPVEDLTLAQLLKDWGIDQLLKSK